MLTPITFPSALEFWLTFNTSSAHTLLPDYSTFAFSEEQNKHDSCVDSPSAVLRKPYLLNNAEQRKMLFEFAEKYDLKLPLHVLVPEPNKRHLGKNLHSHVLSFELPKQSFLTISNVPVIRPELCFLLAARYLSLPELAVLATDLCATYGINRNVVFSQFNRLPVTSVQRIKDYLSHIQRAKGIRAANSAIRFALDCSHSPMESKLGVTYILPLMYGGFAAPRPELNPTITLSSAGASHFGIEECCVDLAWKEQKIIVEYDSDLVHSSMYQIRKDKRKINALELSGYKVFNITKDCFRNYDTAEIPFLTVKRELGVRTRSHYYDLFREKRRDLIKQFYLTYDAMNWLDWARSLHNE